jgi:DNA-binding transcriptional LysR family regulator
LKFIILYIATINMGLLREMDNFVRVVDAGGIGRAADQLGIAKSGVSRRLADLETRLGVTLLNRTTRRSSLTEAGRSFYEGAVKLMGDAEELQAVTSDANTSLAGTLRLAVPLSFGLCHLSAAIDAFASEHPRLDFDIGFSDHHVDLLEQGVDLAIRIAQLKASTLQARRICPIRIVLCASPAYLERRGVPEAPEDLQDHRMLAYDIGSGAAIRLADGSGGMKAVHSQPRMVANNGDFLRDMALAGHGIVMIPTFIAWKSIARGDLVPLLGQYAPPQLSAWAVYPQTRYLSRRARLFIDFLADRFGDQPYWDDG